MNQNLPARQLAIIAGISYWIIFFAAIFANFFALEALQADPLRAIQGQGLLIRLGIMAFLVTVVFDVVVAWALLGLYNDHALTRLSIYFRLMHAVIMGIAVFSLPPVLKLQSADLILMQVERFNTIWLIGLFFFGIHLLLLAPILRRPRFIAVFLALAGFMYIADTTAHFILPNYEEHAELFLTLVAVPSIVGEMSFAVYLLLKGGRIVS